LKKCNRLSEEGRKGVKESKNTTRRRHEGEKQEEGSSEGKGKMSLERNEKDKKRKMRNCGGSGEMKAGGGT
jgi:hypothetical protein